MSEAQRFPFVEVGDVNGDLDVVPQLPVLLSYGEKRLETSGLLDTGASVNVLP